MPRRSVSPAVRVAAVIAVVIGSAGSVIAQDQGSDEREKPRYFRVVDGELVQFDPSTEPSTHHFIRTTSGDRIEIDPSGGFEQRAMIAELVGGWDKIDSKTGGALDGIYVCMGGGRWLMAASMRASVFRVVEGALVPLDPTEPHTGHFVLTTADEFIEVDPDLSIHEQLEVIAPLVGGLDNIQLTGPWIVVAASPSTWASVKASFLP